MVAPRTSFASLKPALLARKGGARPAMRPQLVLLDSGMEPGEDLQDLGWNDFGPESEATLRVVSIGTSALTPAAGAAGRPARRSAFETGRKAAFTLRLDRERHSRLRLACALDARSAQALVTDALDRLLAAMPELDGLVADAATLGRGKRRPAKA